MENFLYYLPSILVLLIVAFTFYLNSLKVSQSLLTEKWEVLFDLMSERLDQIPLIIELCSVDTQRKEAILTMRANCMEEKNLSKQKIENELLMTAMTKEMISNCNKSSDPHQKILLDGAIARFRALGEKIDVDSEKLNDQIRRYNRRLKWPIFGLVAYLRKFKPSILVEFEP